jgi:hypothetical protein
MTARLYLHGKFWKIKIITLSEAQMYAWLSLERSSSLFSSYAYIHVETVFMWINVEPKSKGFGLKNISKA